MTLFVPSPSPKSKSIQKGESRKRGDEFIKRSKMIIGVKNPRVMGSYIKYGLSKVCDIDMNEKIPKNKGLIHKYIQKLIDYHKKNIIKITTFYIYIENPLIDKIISSLGELRVKMIKDPSASQKSNCKIEYYVENFNLHIPDELPTNIKSDFILLQENYIKSKSISDYIKIISYVDHLKYMNWSMDDIINGKKMILNKEYDLYNLLYEDLYIEMYFQDYIISNFISFIKSKEEERREAQEKRKNKKSEKISFDITSIYNDDNTISYYKLIKAMGTFCMILYRRILDKTKNKHILNGLITYSKKIYQYREK